MTWRNVGSLYLGAHQSLRYKIWWPEPGDKGPQWIMAHASPGQEPTELVVSDHAKKLDYSIAWQTSGGQSGYVYESNYYVYLVTVSNKGSNGVTFSLEGGGV